ncbi:class I SAM-dependent methyltransferase [Nonomuraea rhizosphaerae]|uniref:class I SAM-dependent methyltransferase n=1 Tax=Nonomuraea rhizosphaerae TaxID=2665663 RepID=UPI001C607751|nr:class I SAM-dependent methyltransferase [Nonomuraea rhizosphaerae]
MTESAYLHETRTSYDAVAADYVAFAQNDLDTKPFDRVFLHAFAEVVRGTVADVGCGTGRVTALLDSLGVDVFGVDLSPGMLAVARELYPHLRFDEGSMTGLDIKDGALGGVMAYYSLIHIPRDGVPGVLAEFHRVLAPGGHLLLAFQAGEDVLHLDKALGHDVALDFHRWTPERAGELLRQAGFVVSAQLHREADETERTSQAFVLARKPS